MSSDDNINEYLDYFDGKGPKPLAAVADAGTEKETSAVEKFVAEQSNPKKKPVHPDVAQFLDLSEDIAGKEQQMFTEEQRCFVQAYLVKVVKEARASKRTGDMKPMFAALQDLINQFKETS